jgi:hypothetical protein
MFQDTSHWGIMFVCGLEDFHRAVITVAIVCDFSQITFDLIFVFGPHTKLLLLALFACHFAKFKNLSALVSSSVVYFGETLLYKQEVVGGLGLLLENGDVLAT